MHTPPPPTPPVIDPPRTVSVTRILRDWSYADDAPLVPDDMDRLVRLASQRVRRG